ncbi:MAG TPA: STAS domain-containing protein [Vicinamibacterales bacterium]|jgi:anti-anti-sigma regulatory factor
MLKIESPQDASPDLVVALTGTIDAEHLPALEQVVEHASAAGRPIAFDLSQVRLVDRDAVAFFVSGSGRRARLVGCPTYLEQWLESEGRQ